MGLPAADLAAVGPASFGCVHPTGAVLPENQLRFYVQDREYQLTVLAALEDTVGARVGRPFEVGTSATPAAGGAAAPTRLSCRPAGTATEQSAASATR